ncbi:MAG: biotin/lipoyl-containing protein, partial [Rhodospirillales bacterium]
VRVDTGVRQGDDVSMNYDPMIAKIITWDHDRSAAIGRMLGALSETQVVGVASNVALLSAILDHKEFRAGEVDTGFIERNRADLFIKAGPADDKVLALAALAELRHRRHLSQEREKRSLDPYSPWAASNSWRVNGVGYEHIHLKDGDRDVALTVHFSRDGSYDIEAPSGRITVSGELSQDGSLLATVGGTRFSAAVARVPALDGNEDIVLMAPGLNHRLRLVDKRSSASIDEAPLGNMQSPMPGKVIDVKVKDGDTVRRGQPVMVLEAMKMEHTIAAPSDGTIKKVKFAVGELVDEAVELVEFEPAKA